MSNQIIPVQWGKPLRKSEVNTLDKVNELIDFINNSSIHPLNIIDSDQGREVVTGTSTQLAQLEVFGESVQDGTPTPDNPVPVEVVEGRNLFNSVSSYTKEFTGSPSDEYTTISNVIPGVNAILTAHRGEVLTFSADAVTDVPKEIYLYANKPSVIRQTFSLGSTPTRINITFTSETNLTFTIGSRDGVAATVTLSNVQIEQGNQATPYIPYGCIGAKINDEITPIDTQGNVLASLPDVTRDILWIKSTGVELLDKRVGVVDLGELTWRYDTDPQHERFVSSSIASLIVLDTPATVNANILCSAFVVNTANQTYLHENDNAISVNRLGDVLIYASAYTDAAAFKAAMSGVLLYYELATPQTIELGIITPPKIPSGSTVEIIATLQPEFAITWFTENGLPLVVDDLRGYIDTINDQINARIDELHGITRNSVVREPLTLEPIALDPIEKQINDVAEKEPTEESEE